MWASKHDITTTRRKEGSHEQKSKRGLHAAAKKGCSCLGQRLPKEAERRRRCASLAPPRPHAQQVAQNSDPCIQLQRLPLEHMGFVIPPHLQSAHLSTLLPAAPEIQKKRTCGCMVAPIYRLMLKCISEATTYQRVGMVQHVHPAIAADPAVVAPGLLLCALHILNLPRVPCPKALRQRHAFMMCVVSGFVTYNLELVKSSI